ncbi:MAG: arylsulfatase [Verrucomicrobia bacterium]|nr:arylsulfatase [Verrucomicrobiota bacterium]MDA1067515.1 arylsulfatase [Verrucomicrobiota bacterium]
MIESLPVPDNQQGCSVMLRYIGLILALTCGQSQAAQADNTSGNRHTDKPNIVIILADDLGYADVGYNGGVAATPNIDRLASEGVKLQRFYVCPLCSPTRAGLMTGRWPIRYGMAESVITPWRKWGLPTTELTLADMLASAGYERRGAFGKWHLGHFQKQLLPLNRGFTHFTGCYNGSFDYFTHKRENQLDWHRNWETNHDEGYVTDLIGREAVRFIEESPTDKPFFCYVPFTVPHLPLQAKEQDIAKYKHIDNERQRVYSAMLESMDQVTGQILKAIDDKGITDNTVVLFMSDNGGVSFANNGPYRGSKSSTYEGGIRVPAVIRWPNGIQGGGRTMDALMGYIDVYPTLKAIAGVTSVDPNPLDGIDLIPIIRGEKSAPKRKWFTYVAQGTPSNKFALTEGPWKLVLVNGLPDQANLKTPDGPLTIELFHLDRDPTEKTNLIASEPERTAAMLKDLQEHYRLKIPGIPDYLEGADGFVAPKDWVITN